MKNTFIPLDILFLDRAHRIVDIQTMHPEPNVPANFITRYRSTHVARYAIEINAGLANEMGITAGTTVLWTYVGTTTT